MSIGNGQEKKNRKDVPSGAMRESIFRIWVIGYALIFIDVISGVMM